MSVARDRVHVEHTARITKALRGLLIYSPGDAEHITKPV